MSSKRFIAQFLVCFFCFEPVLVFAKINKPVKATKESSVTKSLWIQEMTSKLPLYLCVDGQYHRECYGLDQMTCESEVKNSAVRCTSLMNLPPQVVPEGNGVLFAAKLGRCVHEATEKKWHAKKSGANSRCNDARNFR